MRRRRRKRRDREEGKERKGRVRRRETVDGGEEGRGVDGGTTSHAKSRVTAWYYL